MLSIITILINLLIIFFMFHYFKWILGKDTADVRVKEFENDIEKLIIEINRTTERNLQLIEAKVDQLKNLIADADKVVSVIGKEKSTTHDESILYQKLENRSFFENVEKLKAETVVEKKAFERILEDEDAGGLSLRERAVSMYRSGIDIELISRNLKLPTGEIELIISLYNVSNE